MTEKYGLNRALPFLLIVIILTAILPAFEKSVKAETEGTYAYSRTSFISGGGDITSKFSLTYGSKVMSGVCTHGGPMSEKAGYASTSRIARTDSRYYLAYYYGYLNGYTSGEKGCKLARALHYATYGTAYHQKASVSKDMISAAKEYCIKNEVPLNFEVLLCTPTKTGAQEFIVWGTNPAGQLTLIKKSDDPDAARAGYSYEGIEYSVYENQNTAGKCFGILSCGAGGTSNTLTLEPDGSSAKTYYVKETKSNEYYKISDKWYSVTIAPGEDKTLTVSDSPEYGTLAFRKIITSDSTKDADVEGFIFTLTNKNDTTVKYTARSDKNGDVIFRNILMGTYTLNEKLSAEQEAAGYKYITGEQTVSIKAGENTLPGSGNKVMNEKVKRKPGLLIKKTANDNGPVSGWSFKVECAAAGYNRTFATDSNGEIKLEELKAGTYTVTEVMTNDQMTRYRQPESQTVTLVEDSESLAVLSFENKAIYYPVKIKKISADGKVAGIEFEITGTLYPGTAYEKSMTVPITGTTDDSGYFDIGELPPGKYIAEETGFSDYYINNHKLSGYTNPAIEFTVTKYGVYMGTVSKKDGIIEFENKPYQLKLIKREKTTTGSVTANPVANATYDLYSISGNTENYVGSYTTDENGEFSTYGVHKGNYVLREAITPPGYVERIETITVDGEEKTQPVAIEFSITDNSSAVTVIEDYNQQRYGTVFIKKYDEGNQPVEDAEFTVFTDQDCTLAAKDTGGNNLVKTTDSKGYCIFENIPWGTYYICETAAPRGYELVDTVRKVVIGKDASTGIISVDEELECFTNPKKKGGIEITKVDENGKVISSPASFSLYRDDGALIRDNLVTGADNDGDGNADGDGRILVTGLSWGSYYFLETDAPDGYSISDKKQHFTIDSMSVGIVQKKKTKNHIVTTQVVATKKIKADDIWFAHGTPTFTFKLAGTTIRGEEKYYYRNVTFSQKYVEEHTDSDGYVSISTTFNDIPVGTYSLSEESVARYVFDRIEAESLVNGTISGKTAVFTLTETDTKASATFINKKYEWQDFSDSTTKTNTVKKQRSYTALYAEYTGSVLEGNREYKDFKNHLDVWAIYDDGSQKKLQPSDYTVKDVDGNLFTRAPKAAGPFSLFISYEEDGLFNTCLVIVQVKGAEIYTVTFDTDGGNILEPMKVFKYDSLQDSTNKTEKYIPVKDYKTFAGWYKDAEGTQLFGVDEPVTQDMKLYASYNDNTYTIHYDSNGGTGTTVSSIHTCGTPKSLTENGFSLTGHTFTGWNTEQDGTGTSFSNKQSVDKLTKVNNENITLYAQWNINQGTVYFYPNGGEATASYPLISNGEYKGASSNVKHFTYNDTNFNLPDVKALFTREGYHVTGSKAYRLGSPSGTTVFNQSSHNLSSYVKNSTGIVLELYANWQPNTYSVTFDSNGGTGTTAAIACTYDKSYTLSDNGFSRTGYTFTGWNTRTDGTGTAYTNKAAVKNLTGSNKGTVTLYAQWEANAIAVYSADDKSLRFYNRGQIPAVGSQFNGRTVSEIWYDVDITDYHKTNKPGWVSSLPSAESGGDNKAFNTTVTTVVAEDYIKPESTAYWCWAGYNLNYIDLGNVDTADVSDMSEMFYCAGRDATKPITWAGIELFDTSNVTNMNRMFYDVNFNLSSGNVSLPNMATRNVSWQGRNYTAWNVSKVKEFAYMFYKVGTTTTGKVVMTGDIGTWDMTSAEDISSMFRHMGYYASTVDIKNVQNWNTSNIKYMDYTFKDFNWKGGKKSINLANWKTVNVLSHTEFNQYSNVTAPKWP